MEKVKVLVLPPNLVGHLRIVLLLAALVWGQRSTHVAPILCLLLSLSLDFLDGYLARRLKQATAFGAFYDVVIDIGSRALLWSWGTSHPLAALPILLECITFVCMHKEGGAAWKTGCFSAAPPFVHAITRCGFQTPLGAWAVGGLFGCPLWLWARRRGVSVAGGTPWRGGSNGGLLGLGNTERGVEGTLRLLLASLPGFTLGAFPALGGPLGQLLGSFLEGPGSADEGFGRGALLSGGKRRGAAGGKGCWVGDALLCVLGWGGWGLVLVPGRAVAAVVEVWVIWRHISKLLDQGVEGLGGRKSSKKLK